MTGISRREFGTLVIAGVPLAFVRPARLAAAGSLTLGVSTSSFRDLPRIEGYGNVDDVIRALKTIGAAHIELALANVEPAPPSVAPRMGGSPAYPQLIVLSPQQIAQTNAYARATLRAWRLEAGVAGFEDVRARLVAAGLTVHAVDVAYNASFSDAEIDVTLRQVKALGAGTVSSPLTMAMAARLVPFAARHQMSVAIHNQVDGNAEGLIATGDLDAALALSPAFKIKLDVGNLTASNCDPVAELRDRRARVSHVIIKDRLRNGGKSQPLGEGDTPIAGVLNQLRTSVPSVPALLDYDYAGVREVVDEVASAVAYLAEAAR